MFYVPVDTKIGHFGEVLPSQFLGTALKKLNRTQQNQTTQEHNCINKNRPKKIIQELTEPELKPKPPVNCKNCS